MGSIAPRESLMPSGTNQVKNLDQMDFSKPEKYLKEIFGFISEHIVFSQEVGSKIHPNNLSFLKKGHFNNING